MSKKSFITCKGPAPIPSFPEHWKPQQGEGYEAVVHSFEWHPFVSWIIPFAELKIIGQKTNFDMIKFIPRYDAYGNKTGIKKCSLLNLKIDSFVSFPYASEQSMNLNILKLVYFMQLVNVMTEKTNKAIIARTKKPESIYVMAQN